MVERLAGKVLSISYRNKSAGAKSSRHSAPRFSSSTPTWNLLRNSNTSSITHSASPPHPYTRIHYKLTQWNLRIIPRSLRALLHRPLFLPGPPPPLPNHPLARRLLSHRCLLRRGVPPTTDFLVLVMFYLGRTPRRKGSSPIWALCRINFPIAFHLAPDRLLIVPCLLPPRGGSQKIKRASRTAPSRRLPSRRQATRTS